MTLEGALRRTVADEQADEDDDDAGGGNDKKAHLCVYSLEDRKETVLGDVNNYQITADGKKMLVKIKKDYFIIDLPKDKLETASTCSSIGTLSGTRSTMRPGGTCAISFTRRT